MKNFPQSIVIYSDMKNKKDIILSEESFVEKVNELINIVDDLIECKKLKIEN